MKTNTCDAFKDRLPQTLPAGEATEQRTERTRRRELTGRNRSKPRSLKLNSEVLRRERLPSYAQNWCYEKLSRKW